MELEDVFNLLETATLLEKGGQRIEAATKYYESCYLMRQVLSRIPENEKSSSTFRLLHEKIEFYTSAAQKLYFDDGSSVPTTPATVIFSTDNASPQNGTDDISVLSSSAPEPPASPRFTQSAEINRKASIANANLGQAIDQDENNLTQDAIKSYMSAAEIYLHVIRLAEKSSSSSIVPVLKRRIGAALDRVEALKNPQKTRNPHTNVSNNSQELTCSSPLSKEEVSVLKNSSLIASGLFLPFLEEEAQLLSRNVAAQNPKMKLTPWKDPDGDLPLSDKQKKKFARFARPSEITQQRSRMGRKQPPPVMISSINPYTIRQQYVTDCSFIASLCICALFEKRFQKRLITSIIYPQDKNGIPVYNPTGKYMVKLWLNGIARSVIVDDRLPVDRHSNLLCSQTIGNHNQLELFCSIIEKAYMKLCGGYDFPGSNSGVDLFSLTGWIPERIFFPSHTNKKLKDFETPPDRAWERLYSANSFGDCLITVSTTRDITEKEADSLGLVTGHSYAVLNVFQSRNGTKLLQLKNPWACKGWLGKFSPHDKISWRDHALRKEVGYDPEEAMKHDNGIFYISWNDVLLYFRNLQLSWNPKLFAYRMTTHGLWPKDQGPKIDSFNVGENPQYIMTFSDKAVLSKPTIWVLISRHVSKQEQEGAEVHDFLTIHLVRNSAKLDRVWYPNGKGTIVNGCYTNNPHVLLRYDVSGPEDQYISLVLSQHEKTHDLSYTLSCYCTEPFTLERPPKMLPLSMNFTREWSTGSAGGAVGSRNFFINPMFAITLTQKTKLQVRCATSHILAINVMLLENNSRDPANLSELTKSMKNPILDSGNYRHGFIVTETKSISSGTYVLVCSTYHPGQIGKFILTVDSSVGIKITKIA